VITDAFEDGEDDIMDNDVDDLVNRTEDRVLGKKKVDKGNDLDQLLNDIKK